MIILVDELAVLIMSKMHLLIFLTISAKFLLSFNVGFLSVCY
jgi:hypothetical protein